MSWSAQRDQALYCNSMSVNNHYSGSHLTPYTSLFLPHPILRRTCTEDQGYIPPQLSSLKKMIKTTKHLKRTKTLQTDYNYYYVNAVGCPLHAPPLHRPSMCGRANPLPKLAIHEQCAGQSSARGNAERRGERALTGKPKCLSRNPKLYAPPPPPPPLRRKVHRATAFSKNREASLLKIREKPPESRSIRRSQRAHSITKRRLLPRAATLDPIPPCHTFA